MKTPAVTPHKAASFPYPIDYLGDVLANAARAIAAKIQCPEAMAAQSVLSVASLAAQAVADVRLPHGQTRPLSLFVVSSAQSGDRKTSSDKEATIPVRMHEDKLREAYEPLKRAYDIALAAWRAQKLQIDRRGKMTIEERRFELEALGKEPAAPLRPAHTLNELTVEGLAKNWPSLPGALGIFSAEAGQFLGGHGFSDDAKLRTGGAGLSQLWDGAGFADFAPGDGLNRSTRTATRSHLMIQPQCRR